MADGNDVQICHTCGSSHWADFIVTCKNCDRVYTHLYCTKRVLDGISEQWYCEDCTDREQATNDPKGKAPLHNPTNNRAQFTSMQLNKTCSPPQRGKVKFISEREITFLNNPKYFAKKSIAREKTPKKLKRMADLLGSSRHDKKMEALLIDKDKEASQRNRELKPEKENFINLPKSEVVWKGSINYFEHVSHSYSVQVHLAKKASQKVEDISKKMPKRINLKTKLRSMFWPKAFKLQHPSHEDIGLYFFCTESERLKEKFLRLVERLYKSDQVLVGRIGILGLYLFPSQILPKYNQCINGECYLWGIFQRYKKRVSNQEVVPVTFGTTTSAERENHEHATRVSHIKSNEIEVDMEVDMEIDMVGGVELSTALAPKFASRPDPIIPPGFNISHLKPTI